VTNCAVRLAASLRFEDELTEVQHADLDRMASQAREWAPSLIDEGNQPVEQSEAWPWPPPP
jgi:uncharacterized protein with von Willebrand factor type A (vWA) domain